MVDKTEADKTDAGKTEKVDKTEDFEQRYKDSQSHIANIEQENAALRDTATKDKELFDTISPYINWDEVNGKKTEVEDDGYVDKKTLNDKLSRLQAQIVENQQLQYFRSKYSDLIEHEAIVSAFYNKTDSRKKFEERLEQAVGNTKKLIESQRAKGREEYEKEKKEKAAKEAEASGLSEAKGPTGEQKEPEGESFDTYIKHRKDLSPQAQGIPIME